MSALSTDTRDTITFAVQKAFSITTGVLGAMRVTGAPPSETSLAIAQLLAGAAMLAVAAAAEVFMWRSRTEARRRVISSADASEDRLADRMQLLERALIDRLPPSIE